MSAKKQAENIIVKPDVPLEPIPSVRASYEAQKIAQSLSRGLLTHATLLLGDELLCRDIFLLSCCMLSESAGITVVDNPDIIMLHGGGLTVKDIENVVESVGTKPHTSRRMVYIDGAGRMSEDVQNKFLKTLEEPPPYNQFVLSSPDGLLQTVLSRCMQITLPKTDDHIRALIEAVRRDLNLQLTNDEALDYMELSGNTLDTAYALASDKTVYDLHIAAFEWFTKKSPKYLFDIPDEFTTSAPKDPKRSRANFELILSMLARAVSDMILISEGGQAAFFSGARADALYNMSKQYSLRDLIDAFDLFTEAIERLYSNAPAKQTLDNLYARSKLLNQI